MDGTARPPRTSRRPPTIEELQRDGFVLYVIRARHELVYMLPDRSTWYACRSGSWQHPQWEILNRDDMDD